MKNAHRNNIAIVALITVLICLGLLSGQSLATETSAGSPRIIDGSNVTLMFQITIPGEQGFVVRDIGKFVQGQHQLLPALERVVTGMKAA